MCEQTNAIRERFIKDFKLPINLIQDHYYDYFMDLYNDDFKTREKEQLLIELLNSCQTQEDFFQYSNELSKNIKKTITETKSYHNFLISDVEKQFPMKTKLNQQNIYIEENSNKNLISIDLTKANFNSFQLFGLQKELQIETYDDLIKKHTQFKYYLESKMIRQVIFGDLNPAKQQRIQKYIMSNVSHRLEQFNLKLKSCNSDEIVIDTDKSISTIKELISDIIEKWPYFRIESFIFEKIDPEHNYFLKTITKENGEQSIEFKNSPSLFFAQIYKKYKNLDIQHEDLLFYHEGFLAEFKTPLFENKLIKKINLKK